MGYSLHCPVQLFKEFVAYTRHFLFVPIECVSDFLLCSGYKSYLHGREYGSMTSS